MTRREQIISELEKEYGVECDPNQELDGLCNGDTCRHSECQCWEWFRATVQDHLEDVWHTNRLRGSIEVRQLREMLENCPDQSLPVFIDGKAINEAFFANLESFTITTQEKAI